MPDISEEEMERRTMRFIRDWGYVTKSNHQMEVVVSLIGGFMLGIIVWGFFVCMDGTIGEKLDSVGF